MAILFWLSWELIMFYMPYGEGEKNLDSNNNRQPLQTGADIPASPLDYQNPTDYLPPPTTYKTQGQILLFSS